MREVSGEIPGWLSPCSVRPAIAVAPDRRSHTGNHVMVARLRFTPGREMPQAFVEQGL